MRILRLGPAALPVLSNGLAPKRPDAKPGDGTSGVVKAVDEPKLKLELTVGVGALPN